MKNTFQISLLFLVVFAGCKNVTVDNGDLSMKIDSKMRVNISSSGPGKSIFYNSAYPVDELCAREFDANEFHLNKVEVQHSKEGLVYVLTGNYRKNGFEIEKHQEITIPDGYKNMLVFDTYYVNKGKKDAAVIAWRNHETRVLPNAGNDSVWSLQASSSSRRADWILPVTPGFYQKNYMGMNNSDYGGGIPVVDLWRKDGGIAVGLVEKTLKLVSLPVEMGKYDKYATMCIMKEYKNPVNFGYNDTIRTYKTFVETHKGDFFNPLRQYSSYMQSKGMKFAESEDEAYEPVWCAWGYGRNFTIDEITGTLPKVKELGFKWVDVDDGYQIAEGDWNPNKRFPNGDKDMRHLTDVIHANGLKAKLWWAPLAADPGSKILLTHPGTQLLTEEGTPEFITWWNSYYLSPVNPLTKEYSKVLVKRFLDTWNFDGFKMDGQHMNCCLPDYNDSSRLEYPEQSVERLPEFFENLYVTAKGYKPHAVLQYCPCGDAVNFFNIPYLNQAVASDPTSSWQIRLKAKAYHAISDKLAYYGDHIELSDNGNDFPSQIGVGAVVGSKFTYPKDNPDSKESFLLTPEKEALLKKWVGIYNDKMLSKGKYLNLYDIGYDKPETHVIQKGDTLYYAFFARQWDGNIRLRGLKENRKYNVCEYTTDSKVIYQIEGKNPIIKPSFKGDYLIEVY